MILMLVLGSAALLTSGAPVDGQDSAAPAVSGVTSSRAAPAPVAGKKERKVCRAAADTGSHMTTYTCHTPTEWQALDSADGGAGTELLRSRSGS